MFSCKFWNRVPKIILSSLSLKNLSSLSPVKGIFFYIIIKKFTNTRYSLHYLQNTLRYYKYNTTRSKISCLPRGFDKRNWKYFCSINIKKFWCMSGTIFAVFVFEVFVFEVFVFEVLVFEVFVFEVFVFVIFVLEKLSFRFHLLFTLLLFMLPVHIAPF